jgi:hypothetical protein
MNRNSLSVQSLSLLVLMAFFPLASIAKKQPVSSGALTREQVMLMNLNIGPKSSGALLLSSLRQMKQIINDLDKAQRQLAQIDANYAKSRGTPDDRYFTQSNKLIEESREQAQLLEDKIKQSHTELKSSIKDVLLRSQ